MNDSAPFLMTMRKLAILFRRDLAVARSYRAAFVLELFYANYLCDILTVHGIVG